MAKKFDKVTSLESLEAKLAEMREAQAIYSKFTQEQVDEICKQAAMAADKARIPLAKMANAETGMGVVEDKVIKNNYASEHIFNYFRHMKTCGVISEDKAFGTKRIAEPVGIVGAVTPGGIADSSRLGIPVLGAERDLLAIAESAAPDMLLFTAGSTSSAEEFRRTAWKLEHERIGVIVVPALTEISADRVTMRPVAGLPLVHMDLPRARQALRWTKRLFDVVVATLVLVVISPLLAMIALRIRAHDGGPVIFRQQRVGRDGKHFEFLKFRTMVTDAEAVKVEMVERAVQDRGNTVMFKMQNDPRITAPGRFLRRFSLDELPQLWNVLRGDMSLVGPRPALPGEVERYDDDAKRRLHVRPGITGLWQVSGRSDLSWEDTVRLDTYYVDNWSFTQDIQILVRTVKAVLASSGAY